MRNLKFITALAALCILTFHLSGQGFHAPGEDPNVVRYPVTETPRTSRIIAGELEDDFSPFIKNTRVAHPPNDERAVAIRAAKAEANRLAAERQNPAGSAFKTEGTTILGPVEVGEQFDGNPYDGIPNDNAMAVSANRTVVSGHNSRIHAYNGLTGASLLSVSMDAFSVGMPSHAKCDPRVVYDPTNDRFIVCLLNGFSSSTCQIVVAFSETNDPAGAWNVYGLDGSPIAGYWTDFPQMAISSTELFITGNLFDDASASNGSAVWQIELADGYAGTSLTSVVRTTSYFSLHPVGGGLTTYGPQFYLIRANSESGGSNAFSIHRITNTIAAGGVLESAVGFSSPSTYFAPPDVSQKGTTRKLMTNSCRIQNSYYENGMIYFALNSAVGGRAAIYVGWFIISPFGLSFSAVDGDHVYFSDKDIAYPGIAYGGETGSKGNASFVTYNFTSESDYPGNAASWMSGDHEFSPFQVVKAGTSNINGFANPSRWGDYSDACEVSGTTGEAYMVGSYGKSAGSCGTYISQLFKPLAVSIEQPDFYADDASLSVYPSPANGEVYFDFAVPVTTQYEVNLLDQQGRLVSKVIDEWLREGDARLRFNTSVLSNGVYILQISQNGNPAFYGKVVVAH